MRSHGPVSYTHLDVYKRQEERRRDFKTELQELVQRKSGSTLGYRLVGSTGPDHAKVFEAAVQMCIRDSSITSLCAP